MSKAGAFVKHFFSGDALPGNVPNRELLNYSVGLAGQNISYSYISSWLRYFYISILKVSPVKVGNMFFITHLWDAVNDPVIGSLIDGRRFKSGEKLRPYLFYLPPIIGALSAMMFMGISFSTDFGKLAYLLVIYLVWDILYSVQDVALWGMVAIASPHSDERGRVAQWVSIGAGAGSALAGGFSFVWGILKNTGMSDRAIFTLFGIVFAFGGQLLSMRAHKIQERVRSTAAAEKQSIGDMLRYLFMNKKLLIVTIARIVTNIYPRVDSIYFFRHCMDVKLGSIHLNGETMNTVFPLIAGIPGAAAMFFANKFAIRVGGMKRLLFLAKGLEFVCRVLSFIIGLNGGYNNPVKLIFILLFNACMNIPTSMMDIAHRALTSDGIDEVEVMTGERSEGVAFATQNFVSKLNNGVTSVINSYLLKWLGYNADDDEKGVRLPERFYKYQWAMYILGPAIGAIFYLIAISFVNDDRQKQNEITLTLQKRREEAEVRQ